MRALVWPALALALACAFAPPAPAAPSPAAQGTRGMVVTAQHLASQVGLRILKQGGNAVDAAVATGYALAVVDPCCGNIGGGGFMTLHLADGRDAFINFRERAPLRATRDMYLDDKGNVIPGRSTQGYLAVGVPGTVMGLETALKQYGTMTRAQVMAPAIRLAKDGFILERGDIDILTGKRQHGNLDALTGPSQRFAQEPNVAAIFLNHGRPYRVGERLVQKNLAHTLRLIEKHGAAAFYDGPIADAIVRASQARGGILGKADFTNYRASETAPVACNYHGYHIVSAPLPSSGGITLCEILHVIAPYPLAAMGFHSAAATHVMVEAMRHAYADRNTLLGDPHFVAVPVGRLLSAAHAAKIRAAIRPNAATPSTRIAPGAALREGTDTTHYSIVDDKGNAVSVTYTINRYFGAGVIAGDTGFFLNDEMDDFTSKAGAPNLYGLVQGENNAIAPGKQPLSSMTPTIVTRDGKLFMVLGSPGGSRIITITLETLLNVVDHGMSLQEAVAAPRFHHQWLPDVIQYEPDAFSREAMASLKAMGYHFKAYGPWGAVEAIQVDPANGTLTGVADPRQPAGAAAGY